MQYMNDIKDMLCRELSDISKKGELTAGSLDTVDKITHAIKSIDTILAMDDYSEDYSRDDGYTNEGSRSSYRRGNGNYSRSSYARRRDSQGRYSSDRYSQDARDDMIAELHDLMSDAPDEKTKSEFHKFISKLDNMR